MLLRRLVLLRAGDPAGDFEWISTDGAYEEGISEMFMVTVVAGWRRGIASRAVASLGLEDDEGDVSVSRGESVSVGVAALSFPLHLGRFLLWPGMVDARAVERRESLVGSSACRHRTDKSEERMSRWYGKTIANFQLRVVIAEIRLL
jgi:hypothetical protein